MSLTPGVASGLTVPSGTALVLDTATAVAAPIVAGSPIQSAGSGIVAVPEPGTFVLALVAAGSVLAHRRWLTRRQRS